MCYMSAKVQIRDLRQNLSRYIRRVVRGESLEVTERGRAVAMLVPLPEQATRLERLAISGKAIAPCRNLASLDLPPNVPVRTRASSALRESRRERKLTR